MQQSCILFSYFPSFDSIFKWILKATLAMLTMQIIVLRLVPKPNSIQLRLMAEL
jgi:hypothetical protein